MTARAGDTPLPRLRLLLARTRREAPSGMRLCTRPRVDVCARELHEAHRAVRVQGERCAGGRGVAVEERVVVCGRGGVERDEDVADEDADRAVRGGSARGGGGGGGGEEAYGSGRRGLKLTK